jgi:propanol-preferring alcohol dehydrogenase
MKAMVLKQISDLKENRAPLEWMDWPDPVPGPGELLIKVSACGVCHTELDEIEGRTPPPVLPVILGHQAVGRVADLGTKAERYKISDRVGVAWIYSTCGCCSFCLSGNENVCDQFKATGRDAHGGYADYLTVPETFAYPVPETFSDVEEFLALAVAIPLRPEVQEYKLEEANTALLELKERKIRGAKVLVMPGA